MLLQDQLAIPLYRFVRTIDLLIVDQNFFAIIQKRT